MRGIFEFEAGGKKRGFKFGTYALSVACKKEDCSVDVLFRRCGIPYKDEDGEYKRDPVDLGAFINLWYGAACHYAKSKGQEVDFQDVDVSDWMDELGQEKVTEMLIEAITPYQPKNSTSPTTEVGEKSQ